MKRWLLLGVLALACPLAAQKPSSYDAPELQVPQALYDVLLSAAQEGNTNLTASSEQSPSSSLLGNDDVKGFVVIEVGFPGCAPCSRLLADLKRKNEQGQSLVDLWKSQGIRFYQLEGARDLNLAKKGQPSLCEALGIQSFPHLLLVKDGRLQGVMKGYPSEPEERAQKKAEIEKTVKELNK